MPRANDFQACKACRRLKRKCSKDLPSCSLCVRLQRVCEYGPDSLSKTQSAAEQHPDSQPQNHRDVPAAPQFPFPSTFFLDPDYFQPLSRDALTPLPRPWFVSYAAELLAGEDLHSILEPYTCNIHRWLPMLSVKRLRQDAQRSVGNDNDRGSGVLLFLAMKVLMQQDTPVCEVESHGESSSLYSLAKQCVQWAENGGFIHLRLVQAIILLALYELGHGIYPAVYLTIGHAVRLGTMIGLHSQKTARQLFVNADTWTLCEEQRRTWWAILMLDRIVVVGSPDLLLAAPDPDHDDLLPSRSDTEWTDGEIGSNDAVLAHDLRSPSSLGGFARVCQAVHMLSRVLRHFHMRNTTTDIVSMIHEALNIHRALVELDASLDPSTDDDDGDDDDGDDDDDDDRPTIPPLEANHPALAICSLARLVLYNQYACNEPAAAIARGRVALELEVQKLSLAGIKDLASKTIPQMAREILWAHAQSPSKPGPCPILAHCLYHGATECAWFIREDGDPDMVSGLKDIVAALRFMQTEWQVCKQHLDLLTRGGAIL